MGRLVARAKYLFEGAEKFYVRGVSYGPFAPNSRGEEYPEPERAAADFSLMRHPGAQARAHRFFAAAPSRRQRGSPLRSAAVVDGRGGAKGRAAPDGRNPVA